MNLADFPRFMPWANAAFVVAITIAAIAFLFGRIPQEKKSEEKREVVIIDSWRVLPPQIVTDKAGRTATIQTLVTSVASRELNWVLRSHDSIERLGQPAEIKTHLESPGISQRIKGYKALVAVGAASEELNNTASSHAAAIVEEEDRARNRAKQLRLWIHETFPNPPPVMWLSLGMRSTKETSEKDTAAQRMLVLIGVVEAQPGIDFLSALKSNLNNDTSFPLPLARYTQFELGDTWAN